jgi:hypothetical protein
LAVQSAARSTSTPAVAQRRPLNVLSGIPDNRLCEISVHAKGVNLIISLPGTADIIQFLPGSRFAQNLIQPGPHYPVEQAKLKPGPLLNHIADADRCGLVLKKADQIATQTRRACFNFPKSVARTTRDEVARSLQGIEGLRVPKTIRHAFEGAEGLGEAIAAAGLAWPLLVRIAGDHGGVSTIKLDQPADISQANKLNCYGAMVYATEFCDFASADGRYRKFRIAIIGDQIFLRHMIVGDEWLLHAQRRGKNTVTEEARMLRTFDTELAPKLRPLFLEIARRLDLDYLGVDCNIAEDGSVLLFEANACMNILANTQASPNMWDSPIARIKETLLALLSRPRNWRHPPPVAA